MIRGKKGHCRDDLFLSMDTLQCPGLLPYFGQHRDKQPQQRAGDAEHCQQLDQRKCSFRFHFAT